MHNSSRILITGGSGFIGTNLIDYYVSQGATVLNIDIKPPRKKGHEGLWKECDIRNYTDFMRLVSEFKPESILHMAARADIRGKELSDYSSNTIGVENVIKLSNEISAVKKVIFASTILVCKIGYVPKDENDYCPNTAYGESKMIGEKMVKNAKCSFDWAIVRPTTIWGPWCGKSMERFFTLIKNRRYFNFSGKMSKKTYGYVGNVVHQIDNILMSASSNNRTLYLGDYYTTDIKEWANEIAAEYGVTVYTLPRFMVKLIALGGDLAKQLNINFPLNSFRFKNMTTDNVIDMSETQKLIPSLPFTRKKGNKLTIEWLTSHK